MAAVLLLAHSLADAPSEAHVEASAVAQSLTAAPEAALAQTGAPVRLHWWQVFTPAILLGSAVLLGLSAFFSASEVAYFSLHKLRLRSMRESPSHATRLAARLMDHPGSLLTSILMANSIVNVLLSVMIASPVEIFFDEVLLLAPTVSYPLAIFLCTGILVFFGEVTPKVLVVRRAERFASTVAGPLFVIDKLLGPLRDGMIALTGLMFRLTRFSEMRPTPFITDDEFKVMLSEGEATGVIEKDERQMIQGILELDRIMVRELLVPRRDVIALPVDATAGEALALVREQEYARMPVFEEDLDHIIGVLHAKDLIPAMARGELEKPIRPLLRKPLFVPETMHAAEFVKTAQRLHTHLAVVVDEFGGTEGIVTLQDALGEVVGDLIGDDEEDEPLYTHLGEGHYHVDGALPLDELERLTGIEIDDDEHTTVAGFLMDRSERVLEPGDEVEHYGVRYKVEEMDGRRVVRVLMTVPLQEVKEYEE
jgi:CBS domain containing-hemolysin-like protein